MTQSPNHLFPHFLAQTADVEGMERLTVKFTEERRVLASLATFELLPVPFATGSSKRALCKQDGGVHDIFRFR